VQLRPGRWAVLLTALFTSVCLSQDKAKLCGACHGADGNSTSAGVPSIAGQPDGFLEIQLILFREGLRDSPQMAPLVQGMSDAEIRALAKHFSALPVRAQAAGAADAALVKQGRMLAGKHRCGQCHLPDFGGQAQIPRLAGQREEYLAAQLVAYRAGKRVGSDTSMNEAMYGVSDADIKALAHFLARSRSRGRAR
jgi:cytochrome c553